MSMAVPVKAWPSADKGARLSAGEQDLHRDAGAHVHADGADFSGIIRMECQRLDAGKGLEGDDGLVRQALVVQVTAHTAGPIAAHPGFGPVGIEDAHREIRHVRASDQDQPVGADTRPPVAPAAGKRGRIVNGALQDIDIDIVVAQPLHFCKSDMLIHRET